MTSSSIPRSMGDFWISRDGERKFPAPPRPVEKICQGEQKKKKRERYKIQLVVEVNLMILPTFVPSTGSLSLGSLPRVTEKSSGPDSDLVSLESEDWRMFPTPPRPLDCCRWRTQKYIERWSKGKREDNSQKLDGHEKRSVQRLTLLNSGLLQDDDDGERERERERSGHPIGVK